MYTIIVSWACCMPDIAGAKQSVSGTISDTYGEPLAYATVILMSADDSTMAKGAISDETGWYVLEDILPGDYNLYASLVGYETYVSTAFSIFQDTPLVLHPIILSEGVMMDEVWIVGHKPLYEKQADKTVINIQSNHTYVGSSVLELLAKSPGISVNQQGISMAGKSGVRVMINGKMNRMPMDVVVQILQGMSAAQIEKIELITAPSAKYEAEGNAGIIHIQTSENPDLGTSGGAGGTSGYNTGPNWVAYANFSHRGKNLNVDFSYSLRYDKNRHTWDNYHEQSVDEFLQITNSESRRVPVTLFQNIRARWGDYTCWKRLVLYLCVENKRSTGLSKSILFFNQPERSINLTYSYRFGNNKLKNITIQSRAEEEKQRIK